LSSLSLVVLKKLGTTTLERIKGGREGGLRKREDLAPGDGRRNSEDDESNRQELMGLYLRYAAAGGFLLNSRDSLSCQSHTAETVTLPMLVSAGLPTAT